MARWLVANMDRLVVMAELIEMLIIVTRIQCCLAWRDGGEAKCRGDRLAAIGPRHQGRP